MARPKIDLPSAEELRALADGDGRLAVRVTPGAKTEGMTIKSGKVAVKVRSKPQDGAANTAVIAMVAKAVGCAPSQVELLRGATSREKLLRISL